MATGVVANSSTAQLPQQSQAINTRHAQIKKDDVGAVLPRLAYGVFRVGDRPNVMPFRAKHLSKELRHGGVVVDHENSGGSSCCTHLARRVASVGGKRSRRVKLPVMGSSPFPNFAFSRSSAVFANAMPD